MKPEIQILEILLRLIGAFYVFGAIVGARMITRYSIFDHAIQAISGKPQPTAERWRDNATLAGLAPVFASGLALMFLSPAAPWLFALGSFWQAVYLGWLAPRWLDPHDEPDEAGRAKVWRAFWGYAAITALVLTSAFAGLLRGPSDLAALGAGAFLTAAFASWCFWSKRNTLTGASSALSFGGGDPSDGWGNLSESGFKIREPEDISVRLQPSWLDGPLFIADSDQSVSWGWREEYLSETAQGLLMDFDILFRDLADPYDPRRCALKSAQGVLRLQDGAKDVLQWLRQELGAERVHFAPLPDPVGPKQTADRVKIEPFRLDAIIWSLDEPIGEDARPISEDEFGISWRLARSLRHWAEDWDVQHSERRAGGAETGGAETGGAEDAANPPDDAEPEWTDADYAAHEERGRVLAVQLKRELIATNRLHVGVHYMTRSKGLLEAHGDEDIPPLPPQFPED